MAASLRHSRPGESLAIFPLPGVLLLPRGRLPLNIFEPRYLNMVEDALGAGRLIGMIQPREAFEGPVPDDAALYAVGCVGRITSFAETDDGRFLITLLGVTRFRVADELAPRNGYRRVRPDVRGFAGDETPDGTRLGGRAALLAAARRLFAQRGFELDWDALGRAADEPLVTALAMIAPLDAPEKQALLEAPTLARRAEALAAMIEMAVRQSPGPAAPAQTH